MKRYAQDEEHVAGRAAGIAWVPDGRVRLSGLTALFGDIGTMAADYAVPELVALNLVKVAVAHYQDERALLRSVELARAVR
jgi:hypothetical protein